MKRKSARHFIPAAFAAAAALLFAAGCPNSDPVTGPVTGPGAPTPPPSELTSGAWQGTFRSQWPTDGCGLESPARATFSGVGNQVIGHLEVTGNPCGFRDLTFEGTMEQTVYNLQLRMSGRMTGDPFTDGSAQGILGSEDTTYDFILLDVRNGGTLVGRLTLSRRP